MRVLWLTNSPMPIFEKEVLGQKIETKEGWVTGLFNLLKDNQEISLGICFPFSTDTLIQKEISGCSFFAFPKSSRSPHIYDKNYEKHLKLIIDKYKPDLVQIWGTEYPHALAMTRVFPYPNKTVIHIQGLCHIYANHYFSGLVEKKQFRSSFRDIVRGDNIYQQRKKFFMRGLNEIEALKNVGNIIGRTSWDKAAVGQINPNAKYFFCNEALRDEFFTGQKWNIDNCKRHSIFLAQSSYPIKGVHYLLKAMPIILNKFPDAHLYMTGDDFMNRNTLKRKLNLSGYQKYTLREIVKKYDLENHITFLGKLSPMQMHQQYINSHVHVSPSNIENSSNAIAEAHLLGVPMVASFVGGTPDFLRHGVDSYLYQHDAFYMLAEYIIRLFENDEIAISFSKNSIEAEQKRSNRDEIALAMLNIYNNIIEER